jgi:hypothetical protein
MQENRLNLAIGVSLHSISASIITIATTIRFVRHHHHQAHDRQSVRHTHNTSDLIWSGMVDSQNGPGSHWSGSSRLVSFGCGNGKGSEFFYFWFLTFLTPDQGGREETTLPNWGRGCSFLSWDRIHGSPCPSDVIHDVFLWCSTFSIDNSLVSRQSDLMIIGLWSILLVGFHPLDQV